MEATTSYIIKVIVISAIMYGYYLLSLRNKKFHVYNRFYLLSATFLPILLPLIKLDFLFSPENTSVPVILRNDVVLEAIVIRMNGHFWTWDKAIYGLYFLVAISMVLLFIASLWRIYSIRRKGIIVETDDCVLIESHKKGTPFSFFRLVFWNPKIDLYSNEGKQIYSHELAHVRQLHSLDKLIVNIVQIIFWFNPVFWFIKREINIVHEFLADKESIEDADAHSFSKMALQAAYPGFTWPATNSFFYSPLKRRLIMLLKNKHQKVTYFGRLMVLPLLAGLFLFFTSKVKTDHVISSEHLPSAAIIDTIPHNPNLQTLQVKTVNGNEPVVKVEWKDGKKETLTLKEARAKGINIPPPPPPPPTPRPGASPVHPGKIPPPPPPPTPPVSGELNEKNMLVVVDGKVLNKQEKSQLTTLTAKNVTLLTDGDAISKYGESAKNGVLEINTKNDVPADDVNLPSVSAPSVSDTVPQDTRVFTKVEREAQFPGGPGAWQKYVTTKIQQSLDQFTNKDYGTCVIKFIVDKDGTVSNVEATTMKGTKLAEISVNAIRTGPKWIPARNNGVVVNAYRLQPVTLSNPGK